MAGGVAAARRLRKPAVRRAEGQFLVEGPQAVREAVAAGALRALFATEQAAAAHPDIVAGLAPTIIGDRALTSLAETVTPQGLIGVASSVLRPLRDVLPPDPRLVAVLVDVRDPGNAGTVIRVADAAGADAVIFAAASGGGSVDPQGGKCVRATAGSLFHLPVATGSLPDTLRTLRAAGLMLIAADGTASAASNLDDADAILARPLAWLFGNEAHGLPDGLLAEVDHVLRVPLHGRAESLNLAAAAAVCLYAAARQQRRDRGR